MKKEVILAMSGGVDSSVALYLLLENGYSVRGVTMQNGYLSDQELTKARQAAKRFNVDWEVLSVEKEFEEMVINPFINYYKKGLTPNPCGICNKTIKFGFLFDTMEKKYPDAFFATGHYARIEKKEERYFLQEAVDIQKDQSYFLGTINPGILKKLIFPIGAYHKRDIIDMAVNNSLVSDKIHESQDICFIHDNDYKRFLQEKGIKGEKGKIIHDNGEELGTHKGLFNYTIGQRRGIGISYDERLFVKEINPEQNIIKLSSLKNMHSKILTAKQLNFFTSNEKIFENPEKMLKCKVKSGRQKHDCVVEKTENYLTVYFKESIFAITPGQLCVIYNSEGLIMVSGIIQRNNLNEQKDNLNA